MDKKRILVTGPESNGTKMVAGLLSRAGADVTHHSPMYSFWDGKRQFKAWEYDAVVLVIRDGYCASRSLVENNHIPLAGVHTERKGRQRARVMQAQSLLLILSSLETFEDFYLVTYDDKPLKPERLQYLLDELGLSVDVNISDIGDANEKYYGGEYFRDQRESYERG